jgi:tRNA threonylcarbamoyl adenosine modification protein YjeE
VNDPDVTFEVDSRSEKDTQRIGAALASVLGPGDVVLLVGELGAGKTTLTKAIVAAMGATGVTSPTFVLCHRYDTAPPVAHVDCYRIDDDDALADLALEEMLDDGWVAIVEWGERIPERFGTDALVCTLVPGPGDEPDARRVSFRATGGRWRGRVDELRDRITPVVATPTARRAT